MMKTLKIILFLVLAIVFVVITVFHALFTWGLPPDDTVLNSSEFLEEMGGGFSEVKYRTAEKKQVTLYCQFEDRDYALQKIKKHLRGFLFELSFKYSLPEFIPENFGLYKEAILKYREDDFFASKTPKYKLSALSYFFRVYDNTEENIKVIQESGLKSNIDYVMNMLFTPISTGYRIKEDSISLAERLVNELVVYMEDEFSLGEFSEETLLEYKKHIENVDEAIWGNDKEILKRFIDIYLEFQNT